MPWESTALPVEMGSCSQCSCDRTSRPMADIRKILATAQTIRSIQESGIRKAKLTAARLYDALETPGISDQTSTRGTDPNH